MVTRVQAVARIQHLGSFRIIVDRPDVGRPRPSDTETSVDPVATCRIFVNTIR